MKNFKKMFIVSALAVGAALPTFPLVSQASVLDTKPEVKPVVQPQAQPIAAPAVKDVVHPEVKPHINK